MKNVKLAKLLISLLCVATLLVGAVAGTYAWLVASTAPVENTFTFGNVNITLEETKGTQTGDRQYEFKILPGKTVPKDPAVTVLADSEKCYLFFKVEEENGFSTYIDYEIADGWTALDKVNHPGVYYRIVEENGENQPFDIIKDNQVKVKSDVTKQQIDGMVSAGTLPAMSFVAYAVQFEGVNDAATAWGIANPSANP